MLFILPSIYFLFAFFEKKREELEKKEERKCSNWYLAGFAISFSMTLAVHFYDTMIAGLFCIGIAVGYGFRLFRKQYFGRIMLAGILSVCIAVLPMGIAFATGTPLQGSLGWGMNVITGGSKDDAGGDRGAGDRIGCRKRRGNGSYRGKQCGNGIIHRQRRDSRNGIHTRKRYSNRDGDAAGGIRVAAYKAERECHARLPRRLGGGGHLFDSGR